jgi:hypothetical protein
MKATDIMINDWCYNRKDPKHTPFQIKKIDTKCVMDQNGCYTNLVDLRPIPLTPEILVESGFKKTREVFKLKLLSGEVYLGISFNSEDNIDIYLQDNDTGSWPGFACYSLCNIKFVHELQHILKLFGINENIKL